jgi:hypothetical protein
MTTLLRRWVLWFFVLQAAFVGSWAAFAPESWFRSFPGFGRHWLPMLGMYNEHLARDVGALYLGLMVLSIGAAFRVGDSYLVQLTGASWTLFSALHLIYHLDHLAMYTGLDWWGNLLSLGLTLLAGMALLLPAPAGYAALRAARSGRDGSRSAPHGEAVSLR